MPHNHRTMQCLEIWGGNTPVDATVTLPGLDAWVYSLPYDNAPAGGDVHYVSSCGTGRITRLLVADVSGHGNEVADSASQLRTLMRKFVNHIDQTQFVKLMNEQFSELARAGRFATALVTTFFAPTQKLSLCNAGHPLPLYYQARTKAWSFLAHASQSAGIVNIPLGIDDAIGYEQFEVTLETGDLVLCYTDSLIEAKMPDGELLGADGLIEVVRQVENVEPSEFIPQLLLRIASKCGGKIAGDDITALLFRPNGAETEAPFMERLRVLPRYLKMLFRRDGPLPWPEWSIANIGGAILSPLSRTRARRSPR